MSEVAEGPVHAGKIVEGRATGLNRFLDDVLDMTDQFNQTSGWLTVLPHQTSCLAAGRNAGPMEGLAHVDVAHAHHHFLVQQGQFDGHLAALQPVGQGLSIPRVKRFGTQGSEQLVAGFVLGRKEVDDAKPTRVGVDGTGTVGEDEFEVVMLAAVTGFVPKGRDRHTTVDGLKQRLGRGSLVAVKQRVTAAHPKVREQDTTVVKVDEEVLRTTPDVRHRCTGEGGQTLRKGIAQALSPDEHVLEGLALHALQEALANGLHLRKFRHPQASGARTTKRRWLSS